MSEENPNKPLRSTLDIAMERADRIVRKISDENRQKEITEEMEKYFGNENSTSKNYDKDGNEYDNTPEDVFDMKKLEEDVNATEKDMLLAEQLLQKKEKEIKKQKSFFKRVLFKDYYDLGYAERECEDLKKDFEEKKKKHEQLAVEHQNRSDRLKPNIPEVENGDEYENFIEEKSGAIRDMIQERESIFENHPEFKNIKDIDKEIEKLQKESNPDQIVAGDEEGVEQSIQNKIKELNRLKELRQYFERSFVEIFGKFMDGISQGALDMNAKDYVAQHEEDKTVGIFNALKEKMSPEQIASLRLEPSADETTVDWGRRVTSIVMKNLNKNNS